MEEVILECSLDSLHNCQLVAWFHRMPRKDSFPWNNRSANAKIPIGSAAHQRLYVYGGNTWSNTIRKCASITRPSNILLVGLLALSDPSRDHSNSGRFLTEHMYCSFSDPQCALPMGQTLQTISYIPAALPLCVSRTDRETCSAVRLPVGIAFYLSPHAYASWYNL